MVVVSDCKALAEAETVGGVWRTFDILWIMRRRRMKKNTKMMKTSARGYEISISVPPVPPGARTHQPWGMWRRHSC